MRISHQIVEFACVLADVVDQFVGLAAHHDLVVVLAEDELARLNFFIVQVGQE